MAEEAARSRMWAGANYRSEVEAGLALGRAVAERFIARAEADGSHDAWNGERPPGIGTGPEFWAPPPGSVSPPTQPLGGQWRTWVLDSGLPVQGRAAPAYGSEEFLAHVRAVMEAQEELIRPPKP